MKRQIKVIGVRQYANEFNGNTYTGTRVYYVFNEDNCDGHACDSFKIPSNRASNFPFPHVGDEYTVYLERGQNGVRLDDMVALQ